MKNSFIIVSLVGIVLGFIACDKVEFPKPKTGSSTLNWALFPGGDSAAYVAGGNWPTFTANTNTLRNVLIEDFTGHLCNNCPNAATLLHTLETTNLHRVFGVGVHASPTGLSAFQEETTDHPSVFYNTTSLEIGTYFGSVAGTTFQGNPHGTVNRFPNSGDNTVGPAGWTNLCNSQLSSPLKINLQSKLNYFPSTQGVFLHVEVENLDATLTNPLALVVYVVEDSLIADQKIPNGSINSSYIHRNILRGTIDDRTFGTTLTAAMIQNGKYYLNYSYQLPPNLVAENTHLIIYLRDKITGEVYQVIEEPIE